MRQRTGSALVQILACRLVGAKPLPEPMRMHCQLGPSEQTSVKFGNTNFSFRKMYLKMSYGKWWPFCLGVEESNGWLVHGWKNKDGRIKDWKDGGLHAGSRSPWASIASGWRHNELDGVLNHRRLEGLPNRLFRLRSNKTSKLRVTGLCDGNPPMTGEFPS